MNRLVFPLLLCLFLSVGQFVLAQAKIDSLLPIRGFCIAAPQPKQLDTFIRFINEELAPRQVNTLILRGRKFSKSVTPVMKDRFQGMMQTVWSGVGPFSDEFYGLNVNLASGENTAPNCFKTMFGEIKKLSEAN